MASVMLSATMEGELLKWTNYYSGWQPRYVTVKDGILSYYASKDDVGKVRARSTPAFLFAPQRQAVQLVLDSWGEAFHVMTCRDAVVGHAGLHACAAAFGCAVQTLAKPAVFCFFGFG
jgi:hypothetical protein